MALPDSWLAELLSKNDIVSVVSEYTALSPKGRRMWGLCPFHSEKTPSFSVSADKQLYYCFGCHAGGNVLQFVMDAEKLPFIDAVKLLAGRVNMELPDEVDDTKAQRERALKERLYEACPARRYSTIKPIEHEGKTARAYFAKRSLDMDAVKRFGLGFAPDGWTRLTDHMRSLGFKDDELLAANLANKKEARVYDVFRNRAIFPIFGAHGRIIGFGGRTFGDEHPKYLNSGETPIFNKRLNLYGLNLLKGKSIEDIIIVEGYMDVISLSVHGVDNAVASLGTALTQQQARLAKRYAQNVYIAYDGDSAGQNATLRGLDILAHEGMSVKVIKFPEGLDPDDYIKKYGKAGFDKLKLQAEALNSFKLSVIRARYDLSKPDGLEGYAKEACALISALSPVEQERYLVSLEAQTGFSLETLRAQAKSVQRDDENSFTRLRNTRDKNTAGIREARLNAERALVGLLAREELFDLILGSGAEFKYPPYNEFARQLKSSGDVGLALLKLEGGAAAECSEAISAAPYNEATARRAAEDCINVLRQEDVLEKIYELEQEEKRGAAGGSKSDIAARMLKLQRELIKLRQG
jgi:DNA primase